MNNPPTSNAALVTRADALGKTLTRHGFTSHRESYAAHPGASTATTHSRNGVTVLVLALAPRHGLLVEIVADRVPAVRAATGGSSIGGRPGWRLTCYTPPVEAAVAAAVEACDSRAGLGALHADGWRLDPGQGADVKRPRTTVFHRPDRAATAVFHTPTYTPPCEHCTHHGDLGNAGGWTITTPGMFAEATAHTPADVIAALVMALPNAPVRCAPHGTSAGQAQR